MSSISSILDSISGADQIDQRNRIVTGQNKIPTKGDKYFNQLIFRAIFKNAAKKIK